MAVSPMPHPQSIWKRLDNREEREATVGYHRFWQIDKSDCTSLAKVTIEGFTYGGCFSADVAAGAST